MDVIIPTKNSEKTLEKCLESLLAQTTPVNIMVVDGGSTDKTTLIAQRLGVKIYDQPTSNVKGSQRAIACNRGLKYSKARYVGFVDSDVIVPPNWAKDLTKYFKTDPKLAGVSSGCTSEERNCFSFVVNKVITIGSTHAQSFSKTKKITSVPGYNSFYRRKAIDSVGGFCEEIGGCEDWELNHRLRKNGWRLLGVSESPVEHRRSYTVKKFMQQMYSYGWSRGRLLKTKHIFTPLHMIPSFALISLIVLGVLFPPVEFSFLKSILQAPFPWFEKVVEFYLFIVGLWSFVLLVQDFTVKLWLQTMGTFIIQHLSWAIGWLKGIWD